ncbi:5'-3' exonuclease H3TH domain-containing protein [Endozoicomonas acroporae]|uniref:5'-3' exonuclease H3TH domain-containing protein n=1 Tax=Endozoicomonas acroporae TaxID=1701104 RepID=UPI0013D73D8E|nr:5'-3' exonuclease H3TH domain-containing protein [Endozoicomonas acroporae]
MPNPAGSVSSRKIRGKQGDVPGVEVVGKKGATELLNRFGSLHEIFAPEVANGEKVKGALKKVLEQREQAELSVRLATLQHDVELGLSLKDLRYQETTRV